MFLNKTSEMKYDLAIIGGGPAGYTAAERAAENGLKTVLFEKKAIGGVCLNEGCIPTKTLLYSAKLFDSFKTASKYGIEPEGNPTFDLGKIIGRKNKVVKKLTSGIRMRLASSGVTLVEGTAVLKGETAAGISVGCGNDLFDVSNVLLCTGSETVIPPIKGLSSTDYWTSREALDSKELPRRLAIIGGGVIGIEFASFFCSMGVKVTVIEMLPEILATMDRGIATLLRSEYAKKGVEFRLGTQVTEVDNRQLTITQEGKTEQIEADRILVSVGRRPITAGLGLESLSIEMNRQGVKVNDRMQTSHPHIYAAGDITGFSLLAHTAYREGEVAINQIIGIDDRMSYKAIPAVVYTNPEAAGVGQTEEELKAAGQFYNRIQIPLTYSGRFVAENETASSLCKLLTDAHNRIIGCHLLGNPASEIIVTAGIAVENGQTVEAFKKNIFPHPSVGEAIHEALYL